MRDESLNKVQWVKIHLDFLKKPIVDIILGIVIGLISSVIWKLLS